MRVTTTKLYCDKCGKLLKEGFLKDMYNIPIVYKSIVWGFNTINVTLCKECTKDYFKITKQFLQKADIDDKEKEKFILRNRWDIFKEEPIQQAASLCYVLRRLVNTNPDRIKKLNHIYSLHKKMIIFYNFDYELDILRKWCEEKSINYSEWNGHNHQEVLDKPNWVYLVQYAAGNEGWNCITCDTIVFYSLNYSYKVTKQAEGRIDRMNSPFSTLYYFYLTSRSKIDTAIQFALYKKKKFNESAFSKIF